MNQPIHEDEERPIALITGAAKRVGRACALMLAEAGFDIAFTYNHSRDDAAETTEAIAKLGAKVECFRVDYSKPDAIDDTLLYFQQAFSRLDVLINNASIFNQKPVGEIEPDYFQRHMMINAQAPLMLTQACRPLLDQRMERDGTPARVINFVDIHIMGRPRAGYAAYSMSKAAVLEMTRTLAVELAPKISVNAIAPGVVAWADAEYTERQKQAYLKQVPLDRAGTPEDAARAVKFLATDGDYCNGQVIRVDGGRWLM